jgi:hypothetical protein
MVGNTFNTLPANTRRKNPWLASPWFEPGMEQERAQFIRQYHKETERLLRETPDLKVIP